MKRAYKRYAKKIFAALFSLCLAAGQVSASEVGVVTGTEGRVDLFKAGSDIAVPARPEMVVEAGDCVRTKSNSKAEITFRDKSVVRLAQNSKLEIKDYRLDGDKRKNASVRLARGKMRTIIEKMPDRAEFEILTPNAEGKVRGSDIYTFYQAGNSGMVVVEGRLDVSNIAYPDRNVSVTKGNAVVIPQGELPKTPRPYLDMEKRTHEYDTNVEIPISKTDKVLVIKGMISKLSGDVKVIKKGETKPRKPAIGDILEEGDSVETGTDGLVEIRLDNNNSLNLKQNTKLAIVRLLFNSTTGEYENIFEVTIGKIKARIENLKGNSKFEVKTPTAVCGARGTIMYLDVSPSSTTSFFEGGNGYMTNTLNNTMVNVGSGQNSTAGADGSITAPVSTPEGTRQSYGEGWDPGSGVEGYSAPEGGSTLADADLGGTGGGAGGGDTTPGSTNTPIVDVPITETGATTTTTTTTTTEPALGTFDTANTYFVITGGEPFPPNLGTAPVTVGGEFTNPNNYGLCYGDDFEETVDNVKVVGFFGGSNKAGLMEGILAAFYLKDDGEAGYIELTDGTGNLTGAFDTTSGTFEGYGNITPHSMGTTSITQDGITKEGLADGSDNIERSSFSGSVGGDITGTIDGDAFGLKESVDSRPMFWGLWRSESDGQHGALMTDDWSAISGGVNEGTHGTSSWLTEMDGSRWSDGILKGTISGSMLSYNAEDPIYDYGLGEISGNTIGNYNTTACKALSCGTYTETPLAFGGTISDERYNSASYINGLFGGTEDLLDYCGGGDGPQATIIGAFDLPAGERLWEFDMAGQVDTEGGRMFGFAGGARSGESLRGLGYAIYVTAEGDIGYVKFSDIEGICYPSIDMFQAIAYLESFSMGNGGYELPENQDLTYDSDLFRANSIPAGLVSGDSFSGGLTAGDSIDLSLEGEDDINWSIWRTRSNGTYRTDRPLPANGWQAVVGGYERKAADEGGIEWDGYSIIHLTGPAWTDGNISGTVYDGTSLSFDRTGYMKHDDIADITGDIFGGYGAGSWQIYSIGMSTSQLLQFGGPLEDSAGYFGHFGYYDEEHGMLWDLSTGITGLLGGTQSPWGNQSPITIIGTFGNSPGHKLWGTDINGYTKDGSETARARYAGLAMGSSVNNILRGGAYAFYVRPIDDGGSVSYVAGVMRSTDISGDFYTGINMFEATGTMGSFLEITTSLTPADLYPAFKTSLFTGKVAGDNGITGNLSGSSRELHNQDLGDIFKMTLGGSYTSTPAGGTWQAVLGGSEHGSPGADSYWIIHVTGDEWSDGSLHGTMTGRDIGYSNVDNEYRFDHSWVGSPFEGSVWGAYTEGTSKSWEAVAVGYAPGADLTFGGDISAGFGNYDPVNRELSLSHGSISSVFGGSDALWTAPSPGITIMGEYSGAGSYCLWGKDFFKGGTDGKTVDYGGGAILGFIGGLKLGNTLKALVSAIYIRPYDDGGVTKYKAGYITSTEMSGNFFQGIGGAGTDGMFEAIGTLDPELDIPLDVGTITPLDLYNENPVYVNKDSAKNIMNSGIIRLADSGGNTVFSGTVCADTLNIEDQSWSIWRCAAGGAYRTDLPLPETNWSADMGGWSADSETMENHYWMGTISSGNAWPGTANTAFSANVSGSFLGSENLEDISGQLLLYYNNGAWEGYGTGVNTQKYELTSSGNFIVQGWDTGVGSSFDFAGHIGLIGRLWSSEPSPKFVSIGEFNAGGKTQFAWQSQKVNSDPNDPKGFFYSGHYDTNPTVVYHYATYDDPDTPGSEAGAFVGLSAGVGGSMGGENNKLKGLAYAICVSPSGNTGVLYCDDLDGYYTVLDGATGDGMYRLDGTFEKNYDPNLNGTTTILPEDLRKNLSIDRMSGISDGGGFVSEAPINNIEATSGEGTLLALPDQGWGVWNMVMSGTWQHDGTPPDSWGIRDLTATVSPVQNSSLGGAWYGAMTGTKWSGNEIEGRLNAMWIQIITEEGSDKRVLSGILLNGVTFGNYIDVDVGTDTWRAATCGTGYDYNTNLCPTRTMEELNTNVIAMWNATNFGVPITVVHSEIMSGSNSFMPSVTMNTSFYGMIHGDGIWAALINGYFTSPPPDPTNWTVSLAGTDTNATLQGTRWDNGQWAATVSGTSTNANVVNFSGQAAGTYTGTTSGTLEGVATGTFEKS